MAGKLAGLSSNMNLGQAPVEKVEPSGMNKETRQRLLRGLACVAVGAFIWNVPMPAEVQPAAWDLLAVFVATIAAFILQPLPIGATSLIVLALLPVLGILKPGEALQGFSNTTVWLIVAAFMFAEAFIKTGLGTRIAYALLSRFGSNSLNVAYVMSAADFIIAPFTPSNTARGGGIIYPIIRSVIGAIGADEGKNRRTAQYLLFSSYAAVITSACIFLTGASNNVLANTLAQETFGMSIGWSDWFLACIVPGLLLTILTPFLLYKIMNPELKKTPETQALAKRELQAMGKMSLKEKMLCVIFLTALVLWATGSIHGIDSAFVALLGLAAMLLTGILEWPDITKQHGAWDVLIWMGVLINMAAWLSKLGLMSWFGALVGGYFAGMSWLTMLFGLAVVYVLAHYFLASNSAHIMALFTTFATVLIAAGAPTLLVLILFAALCNSASFLTHYGCGVTPIFFGSGLISQVRWWKLGFILAMLHLLVWMGIGMPWMKFLGLF